MVFIRNEDKRYFPKAVKSHVLRERAVKWFLGTQDITRPPYQKGKVDMVPAMSPQQQYIHEEYSAFFLVVKITVLSVLIMPIPLIVPVYLII